MNIEDNISYTTDKANVYHIQKSDRIKYFAVALGENAVLKKHTTPVPAFLVVLKGKINFVFDDRQLVLSQFDTFEIPVDVVHEVRGVLSQNLFTVLQAL